MSASLKSWDATGGSDDGADDDELVVAAVMMVVALQVEVPSSGRVTSV